MIAAASAKCAASSSKRMNELESKPDNLTLDRIMAIFIADLRRRGIDFHVPSDPLSDTGWILMLQRTYVSPTLIPTE
jgi:hypothetical protein